MMNQRLFEITFTLTQRGAMTAGELAERFGVSRRTIYRDIDALSSAGIPVYAEKGKGGGIRMMPGYVLDKGLFSKEEQAQLVSHFNSLAALGTPDTQGVLDKLAALFGMGDTWLEVDFAPWHGGDEMRNMFRMLRDAILRRQVVRFNYYSAGGERTDREVEPYKVVFRGQGWYLHAFCRLREAFRYFKLTRLSGAFQTGEQFSVKKQPEKKDVSLDAGLTEVTLHFQPQATYMVMDEFCHEAVTHHPDGCCTVKTQLPEADDWVTGYILSFGPGTEVVDPPRLRQKIGDKLRAMAAGYS